MVNETESFQPCGISTTIQRCRCLETAQKGTANTADNCMSKGKEERAAMDKERITKW